MPYSTLNFGGPLDNSGRGQGILEQVSYFWFRRDLRLNDNAGLYHALRESKAVIGVFIFDADILTKLPSKEDLRVQFIYDTVADLQKELRRHGGELLVFHGQVMDIWAKLLTERPTACVYTNHDYEPDAIARDLKIEKLCAKKGCQFRSFKDQVIFEKDEIVTEARKPYTVYTPYKKKWLASLSDFYLQSYPVEKYFKSLVRLKKPALLPSLESLGFQRQKFSFPEARVDAKLLKNYENTRDLPGLERGTSHLGLHLRFGTVSVREMVREARKHSAVWLSELIWREFFMQVLFHFPHVVNESFRPQYDQVAWRKSRADFQKWCEGKTGYPLVDAGMRELNATGFMHNRVRMVTASFLSKHLLLYWLWGERYFAEKLLDYELSANNGNWQWAAGTGCDAAPYFRVFNPETQAKRFDGDGVYIRKWIPEWGTKDYPEPMVDHAFARQRALSAFKKALKK